MITPEDKRRLEAVKARLADAKEPSRMTQDVVETALCQIVAKHVQVVHNTVESTMGMVDAAVEMTLLKVLEHSEACTTLEEFTEGLRKATDALTRKG